MQTLWIDLETFNTQDIRVGTYRYAETAEIMLVAYAIDDGPSKVWDCTKTYTMPKDLHDALKDPTVGIVAHNAMFDRSIIANQDWIINRHGNFKTPDRWRCTMVQAMLHGFPGSLDALCTILDLPQDQSKLKSGKSLIRKFCVPAPANHNADRYDRTTHPKEWAEFVEYARMDIDSMREVSRRLPKWNCDWPMWRLDQRINDRGFLVDTELTKAGMDAAQTEKELMAAEFARLTNYQVMKPTQREQFRKFLNDNYDLDLENTQKSTLTPLVGTLDKTGNRILELALSANKTSTSKYKSLHAATSTDGRFRGGLQFSGAARTRRWSGRTFQPQNLPSRGLPPADETERFIEAIKLGCHDFLFEDTVLLMSAALRGVLIAPKGKRLEISDLSNIEGRVNAWLAGEQWKLDAFKDFDDGTGDDLYNITAGSILGKKASNISKSERNSFGKVPELACFSGDTLVVTEVGLKRLDMVTEVDRLWDGEKWTTHQGVVSKGRKEVILLDGVEVTPDHLIKTKKTWSKAEKLGLNGSYLRRALATGSEICSLLVSSSDPLAGYMVSLSNATAEQIHSSLTYLIYGEGVLQLAETAVYGSPLEPDDLILVKKLAGTIFGDYLTERAPLLGDATTQAMQGTPTTGREESLSTMIGELAVPRLLGILRHCPAGIDHILNWIESTLTMDTGLGIYGLSPKKLTETIRGRCGHSNNEFSNLRPVFDIVNVGENNCFTVKSDSGYLLVHNCGYQGGFGAFQTFAKAYGIQMRDFEESIMASDAGNWLDSAKANHTKWGKQLAPDANKQEWLLSECVKLSWRDKNSSIRDLWYECDNAARSALSNAGEIFSAGEHLKFKLVKHGFWYLLCRMPSGKTLTYFDPKLQFEFKVKHSSGKRETVWAQRRPPIPNAEIEETGKDRLTYMGIDAMTKQWRRLDSYGGKFVENACQSLSLDILQHNMPEIEKAGYDTVLTVHDEVVTEVPDTDEYSTDRLSALLAKNPPWAEGLPLAAAGFSDRRYRKD